MALTYRDILKWGDKRENKIDTATLNLIKEKFNIQISDKDAPHLSGNIPVSLGKACRIAGHILDSIAGVTGKENISIADDERASHAYGKYYSELLCLRMGQIPNPPDAVVYPGSIAEIEKIVSICNQHQIPITPQGGLSSVTGGASTSKGGISLDLTKRLNKVLEINPVNQTATIQAGIYGPALEAALNKEGFSCGHFPQSFEFSTLGGWIAAKGAGQASTGYGKIEDMICSLTVITPSGTIKTPCYPKSAQGWDLHSLFPGSEGTLGIIAEVIIKIKRYNPNLTAYSSFIFKDFSSACLAMRNCMQGGIGTPHLFRISDPEETEIAFKTSSFENSLPDKALKALGFKSGNRCLMFVSVEGQKVYTHSVIKSIKKICGRHGGFFIGAKPTKKWLAQRYSSAYLRDPLMDAGIMTDTLETAVMWDNLIPVWQQVRAYLKNRKDTIAMTHISHVYENGANLYFTFLSPMQKGNEIRDYIDFHKGLVDTIQNSGAALSHHHGIGKVLAPWMQQQMGPGNMVLMQAIKNHLDPNGIMNPGNTLGLLP